MASKIPLIRCVAVEMMQIPQNIFSSTVPNLLMKGTLSWVL